MRRRTPDNPHKCLIPKFPKTAHFCPDKIFEIWAFLSEMTPDFPAGRPNLSKHGSNLDRPWVRYKHKNKSCKQKFEIWNMFTSITTGICHWRPMAPDLNRRLHNSLKKSPLDHLALSEHTPDLGVLCELLSEPRTDQHWPNRPFCPSGPQPLGPKWPKFVQLGIKHLWELSGVLPCSHGTSKQ